MQSLKKIHVWAQMQVPLIQYKVYYKFLVLRMFEIFSFQPCANNWKFAGLLDKKRGV